ncbi:MAG: GntR family transcriptional regulator [Alphaproteobacteria bacterium]|nr:GntR family transcriptional regulator [Alphaproteobacteria bacterium]
MSLKPRPAIELPEPLSRFIARRLAEAIENGRYAPGERISEEAVAVEFGTSRGPVREALALLEREELVVVTPRRGARVIEFDLDEIDAMFAVRAVLFALVVESFTLRATAADLEDLDRQIDVLSDADVRKMTAVEFIAHTQKSSRFVLSRCGNPRLQRMFMQMNRQAYPHYAAMVHRAPERRIESNRAARRLRQLILDRDAPAAFALARSIVEGNRRAALAVARAPRP